MKLNKLLVLPVLLALAVVVAAASGTAAHAQTADRSLPPLADLSIAAEPLAHSSNSWTVYVQANRVGRHPLAEVRDVKVRISAETVSPGFQVPGIAPSVQSTDIRNYNILVDSHSDGTLVWTIPQLSSRPAQARIHPPSGLRFVVPAGEVALVRVTAQIVGDLPEPPGFQDNNAMDFWYSEDGEARIDTGHNHGDAGVSIKDISDRSPRAGEATTFTVVAESHAYYKRYPFISVHFRSKDFANHQLGVRVKIRLSPGLAFASSQTPPSGTTFSATSGIWNVGTLMDGSANRKSFPVAVSLTSDSLADLPLEKRCLTAEVVSAVPWFESDISKRENDITIVCLGEREGVLLPVGGFSYQAGMKVALFHFKDCVGDTSGPCTGANTLELLAQPDDSRTTQQKNEWFRRVTRGQGSADGYLRPEQITVQVRDPLERQSDGTWRTGEPGLVHTYYTRDLSIPGTWTHLKRSISVPAGVTLPGSLSIRPSTNLSFNFLDPVNAISRGPFALSRTSNAEQVVIFGALGTYKVTPAFDFTHKTIDADNDGNKDVFTASGTYTFHVGPMADLEVRDAGASRAVDGGRQAYTVMAVNNGPDEAPAVRVTGLPTGVTEYVASDGEYDPTSGVWTIGGLTVGDRRLSGHAGEGPILTLITDDANAAPITATIENTQDYCVRIKTGATDPVNDLECAGSLPTGYTEHSTAYYDYIEKNSWATITARAGAGYPGAPAGVTLMETSVANILMWEPVERVNGFEVTHYEVERSASPWTTLPKAVRDPMYVDMNLRPGHLMQYRVRAVNIFGVRGPWSVPTTTGPDAPGDFTAEQLQSGEVRLTWTKPDGNGAEITGYTIQVSTNAGGSWAGTGARPGADDTSWIHRNLPVGPVRLYRIRASTANGPGPWAQATSAEVGRPFLIANYDGASKVALSWIMPSGHAVPVQSWELEHSANGVSWSRLSTVRAADGMSYVHSGLSPGDFRHYRVRAVTAIGHGPWSEPATAATAAGVPRNFRAQANGPNEIVLSWNKPTGDAEIWEYQIERKTEGLDWSHLAAVFSEEETSYVDDGLSPGGTWSYRVRAVSIAAGNLLTGEWSSEASATTDSGGPEPPKDPVAAADGENAVKLSWTEPEDNGSPITGYRIEHSTDGGGTWALLRARHSGTAYSHTGLPSGTSHHYRVAAINRNGRSPFSSVASATTTGTPATVPGMPADLRVTGVDRNRVSIAWSPPADDGGARVTGYEYRYLGPCAADPADLCQSGAVRASGTSASIGGLNVAGTYDFMVRAINAVGAGEWSDPVQADIAPEARGKVVVTPSSLTVTEGGSATYRVKLSHEPAQPIQLGLFWEDPDNDLSLALAGYQGMLLLPGNYAPPEGAMWDGWAYRWNVGIPITVEAVEDDDAEDGGVVIHHDVWTAPADLLGNPPDWAEDPVYHFMTGPAVKVTVRDND